jgi:hypothetical protein
MKEIASWDLYAHCLISVDRYEVKNRAGSGLFFISVTFSYSNLQKYAYAVKILLKFGILELLHSGGFLFCDLYHQILPQPALPGIAAIKGIVSWKFRVLVMVVLARYWALSRVVLFFILMNFWYLNFLKSPFLTVQVQSFCV